jgi:broad-specificity NMP kinase
MVIVLTAYPHFLEHNDRAWRDEKASLNLMADFIASLPSE